MWAKQIRLPSRLAGMDCWLDGWREASQDEHMCPVKHATGYRSIEQGQAKQPVRCTAIISELWACNDVYSTPHFQTHTLVPCGMLTALEKCVRSSPSILGLGALNHRTGCTSLPWFSFFQFAKDWWLMIKIWGELPECPRASESESLLRGRPLSSPCLCVFVCVCRACMQPLKTKHEAWNVNWKQTNKPTNQLLHY